MKEFLKDNQKVNPAVSSFLEDQIKLEQYGYTGLDKLVCIDKNTNEIYYEIDKNAYPEVQKLASLLLKGVVNSVDIVKVGERYYSHNQKSENIEKIIGNIDHEIKANEFILNFIFSDYDHDDFWGNKHSFPDPQVSGSWLKHHNLMIDKNRQKLYYFDFEKLADLNNINTELYKSQIKYSLSDDLLLDSKKDILNLIKNKLTLLSEFVFNNDKLEIFQSIIKKSGAILSNDNFREFLFYASTEKEREQELFNEFKNRVDIFLSIVEQELEKYK